MTTSMILYLMITLAVLALAAILFVKLHFAASDMEAKVTGIWSNKGDDMRILIYYVNSRLQGEVIWLQESNDRILGTTVIQDMPLRSFGWSKGTFIDPVTRSQSNLRLKLRTRGSLCFRYFGKAGKLTKQENWKLVI